MWRCLQCSLLSEGKLHTLNTSQIILQIAVLSLLRFQWKLIKWLFVNSCCSIRMKSELCFCLFMYMWSAHCLVANVGQIDDSRKRHQSSSTKLNLHPNQQDNASSLCKYKSISTIDQSDPNTHHAYSTRASIIRTGCYYMWLKPSGTKKDQTIATYLCGNDHTEEWDWNFAQKSQGSGTEMKHRCCERQDDTGGHHLFTRKLSNSTNGLITSKSEIM